MSTTKRISGDYFITSIDPAAGDNITITTHTLTVNGNLDIIGGTTEITTTQTVVQDAFITLAKGNPGSIRTMGIEVEKNPTSTAVLRYNTDTDQWEISNDSVIFRAIATAGFYLNQVVDDLTPQLGGDLDVNGHAITSASNGNVTVYANGSGLLKIDDVVSLQNQTDAPNVVAGYNKLYSGNVEGGGTGLHFTNSQTSDELVSKTKAIVYGIIF